MKRLAVIMITATLCLGLYGCSKEEKSQYDEKTNQKIAFFGIHFQLPKEGKIRTKQKSMNMTIEGIRSSLRTIKLKIL